MNAFIHNILINTRLLRAVDIDVDGVIVVVVETVVVDDVVCVRSATYSIRTVC